MSEAGSNARLLAVRLVAPDRVLLDATAESVELPSMCGYMETLYGAAPLLAELGSGEVRLHGGSAGEQTFFVAWGCAEVLSDKVTILAEVAMPLQEIDVEEARAELRHGSELWDEAGDDPEKYDKANAVIRVAEAKLYSASASASEAGSSGEAVRSGS
ncbi:MAG: ATP synthase F1 subunit epsilon [Acidobacteriaceae bacterium]